jgi:hypothetical protein
LLDALDLAAVDVEFAGDGALAATDVVPGTYRLFLRSVPALVP